MAFSPAFRALVAVVGLALASAPALAQSPPYYDDRSGPAEVIRSLYNAIQRGEYARAWDYFSEPPAASFEAYAESFEDTASADIDLGGISSEGAAGSVYYEVPVILTATDRSGNANVFSGCYTLRQVNAAIQEPPFRPIMIETGTFRAADPNGPLFPADCGAADSATAGDGSAEVMAMFTGAYADICYSLDPEFNPDPVEPDAYPFTFRYESDPDDFPDREVTLYRVWCSRGAYTEGHVYYLQDDTGEIRQLSFAYPAFEAEYADDGQSTLRSIKVDGFGASEELQLSDFDPATLTITEFVKFRGLGDASASGTWAFIDGAFQLTHYDVDPTYDGEINAITLVEDGRVVR